MSNFKKFNEKLPSKEKFYSSLTGKNMMTKSMNISLKADSRVG